MAMAPIAPRSPVPMFAQNTPDVALSEALLRQAGSETKAPLLEMFLENAKSADMDHAKTAVINMAAVIDDPNLDEEAAKNFYREHADEILTTVQAVLKHVLESALPDLSAIVAALHVLRFGLRLDSVTAKKFAVAIFGALLTFGTGGSPLLVYLLTKASMKGLEEAGKLIDALVENIPQEQFAEEVLKLTQQNDQALHDVIGKITDIANDENAAGQAVAIKFLQYIMDDSRLKDLFTLSKSSHVETSSQRSFFAAKYLNVVASAVYSLAATSSNSVDGSSSDIFGDNQPTEWDAVGTQLELLYPINFGSVQLNAGAMGALRYFAAQDVRGPDFKTVQLMGDVKLTFPIATHFGFAVSFLAGWQFYFMESNNAESYSNGDHIVVGRDFKDFDVLTFGAKAELLIPIKDFWGISLGAQFIDAQEAFATEWQARVNTGAEYHVIPADGRFELMGGPIFSW